MLPIRVDVPRAGISHEFIKPLVVGDSHGALRYNGTRVPHEGPDEGSSRRFLAMFGFV